jgi:hypothetical protein
MLSELLLGAGAMMSSCFSVDMLAVADNDAGLCY